MEQSSSSVVYEIINDRYRYAKYLDFRVIEDTHTGFINATKLCALAEKKFKNWLKTEYSKDLIQEVKAVATNGATAIVKGGSLHIIEGTYVHPDLAPHIASWCSAKFAIKVSRIVNEHIRKENERLLRVVGEKDEKIDQMSRKIDELLRKTDHIIGQNDDMRADIHEVREVIEEVHERVVEPNDDTSLREEFCLLRHEDENDNGTRTFTVVRAQKRGLKTAISRKQTQFGNRLAIVLQITSYMNPKNLYNRLKERVKGTPELKRIYAFRYNDFETSATDDDVISLVRLLEEETGEKLKSTNVMSNVRTCPM